jgi:hypothetical protein
VLAAETIGFVTVFDIASAQRDVLEEIYQQSIPLYRLADSYYFCSTVTQYNALREKRLSIEVAVVREACAKFELANLGFVRTAHNLADSIHRSALYAPQANGIAERANRTIFETARMTLVQSGFPNTFWAEAVRNVAAIHNRFPKPQKMSPFEKLYDRKPSVNKFRPFGCLAYVFQHESKRKKLDSKSIPCILLATLKHR